MEKKSENDIFSRIITLLTFEPHSRPEIFSHFSGLLEILGIKSMFQI
jgi:hypothetical protein